MFTSTLVGSLSLPLQGLPLSDPVCFHGGVASQACFFSCFHLVLSKLPHVPRTSGALCGGQRGSNGSVLVNILSLNETQTGRRDSLSDVQTSFSFLSKKSLQQQHISRSALRRSSTSASFVPQLEENDSFSINRQNLLSHFTFNKLGKQPFPVKPRAKILWGLTIVALHSASSLATQIWQPTKNNFRTLQRDYTADVSLRVKSGEGWLEKKKKRCVQTL